MTERLVIDASVLAKSYLRDETHTDRVDELLDQFALGHLELMAPQLVLYEVPSTILNAVRRRRLDLESGRAAVEEFFRLQIPTVETPEPMIRRAFELAHELSCKLYDALYVALALELNCPFVTADARLHRGLTNKIDQLVWIGDYEAQARVRS